MINKSYKQLESLCEKAGPKKEKIREYLADTQEDIQRIANSLFKLDDLEAAADTQMKKLQAEWRTLACRNIRKRLKTVHFKIESDSMAAVCGSDRIEVVSQFQLVHPPATTNVLNINSIADFVAIGVARSCPSHTYNDTRAN